MFYIKTVTIIFVYINIKFTSFIIKKTRLWPFLWIEFNCLKAEKPLQRDRLLLTTKIPGNPDTHLINLGRMKG